MKGRNKMFVILNMALNDISVKRPIDEELIFKIADGDTDAFHTLYDLTAPSVYGFALSITKNSHDADDVMQETFLKVYQNAGSYQPKGKPMAWIFTIARNIATSKFRQDAKTDKFQENYEGIDLSSIKDADNRILVKKLFELLSDDEKQILMLHAVSGLKHREIAEVLNLSLGTTLSKYHRAIKKLKSAVKEEDLA